MSNIFLTTHSLSTIRLSVFACLIDSIEGHLEEEDDSELLPVLRIASKASQNELLCCLREPIDFSFDDAHAVLYGYFQ